MNPSYTIEDVDIKTLYRMMLEHLRAGGVPEPHILISAFGWYRSAPPEEKMARN